MQKENRSLNALNVRENVLIKDMHRQQYLTSKNIVSQAQYRAKNMVNAACQEADLIQKTAYRTGYERGLLMAVEAVTLFINSRDQLVNDVYRQLRDEVKTLLMEAVNQESVILALFENWTGEIELGDGNHPFHILLPFANRQYTSRLMAFISHRHPGGVIFEFHQDSHYVFKYREQLVEFSPEIFVDNQAEDLLVKHDLYAECETLSMDALDQLHEQIKTHLPREENVTHEEVPSQGDYRHDND